MFACGSSVHQKCFSYTATNFLFGLCKSMWIIVPIVTCPSPYPEALARPSTPKMLRAQERAPTPYPSIVFTLGLIVEFIQEFRGVSIFFSCIEQVAKDMISHSVFIKTPKISLHLHFITNMHLIISINYLLVMSKNKLTLPKPTHNKHFFI
jgi:hypothetical protein